MPTTTSDLISTADSLLIGNYARRPFVMHRGEGVHVWDTDGVQYLDLFAGFGGCVLGHCHPDLVAAVEKQSKLLWHVGNTYHSEPQLKFARHLADKAFDGRAFFCHGGLDANESAVKLARLRGSTFSPQRYKTITFNMSFHGRSLALIAAGSTEMHREGFGPMPPGFVHATGGDFEGLVKHVDDETCAIMFEPLRGEGGMHGYPDDFPQKVRDLCDEREITLIFDEVWTGGGRTGKWFGYQYFGGVEPDIMTLGKAIGGGLPVGCMWVKPDIAKLLVPGKHGSTLGGNLIGMAVAATISDVIERDNLLDNATNLGEHAKQRFAKELPEHWVRGDGLFLGIEMPTTPRPVDGDLVAQGLEKGILLNVTQKTVVRLAPSLTITKAQWDQGLDVVIDLLKQ